MAQNKCTPERISTLGGWRKNQTDVAEVAAFSLFSNNEVILQILRSHLEALTSCGVLSRDAWNTAAHKHTPAICLIIAISWCFVSHYNKLRYRYRTGHIHSISLLKVPIINFYSSSMYFCISGMSTNTPSTKNDNLQISTPSCPDFGLSMEEVELIIIVTPLLLKKKKCGRGVSACELVIITSQKANAVGEQLVNHKGAICTSAEPQVEPKQPLQAEGEKRLLLEFMYKNKVGLFFLAQANLVYCWK